MSDETAPTPVAPALVITRRAPSGAIMEKPYKPIPTTRMNYPEPKVKAWLHKCANGVPPTTAGLSCGIRPAQVRRVLEAMDDPASAGAEDDAMAKQIRGIARELVEAWASAEARMVAKVDAADRNWQAAAWWLERLRGYVVPQKETKVNITVQQGLSVRD